MIYGVDICCSLHNNKKEKEKEMGGDKGLVVILSTNLIIDIKKIYVLP
jgi:hypothetical protein